MIKISKALVGSAELEAMGRVIREDGYLGIGREVRAFEEELQEYLGGQGRKSATLRFRSQICTPKLVIRKTRAQ